MPRRRTPTWTFCQTVASDLVETCCWEPGLPNSLRAEPHFSTRSSLPFTWESLERVWYAACTVAPFMAIVDIAIILGGILLAAWLLDGQAS